MLDSDKAGACQKCLNYQQPDKKVFTNTWIGRPVYVGRTYLVYRWVVAILVLVFFIQSFISRALQAEEWWKYFLLLANWGRVLAVLTYTWEVVLVTTRWRRELDGQVELFLTSSYAATGSPLPWSHRALWMFANVNSVVSALCSIVYWPFLYNQEPLDFQNITGHGLITAINVLDVFISARPWRCLHAYHVQLFCLVYVLSNFAYIEGGGTSVADQPYIYSILDWSKPTHCLITIFGVMLILPFLHFIFILLYKCRCLLSKALQSSGPGDPTQSSQGIEMVEGSHALLEDG
eukprot:TRINITY_DN17579_c0_g1_i1.p1 TRINITY_DN17579_c0_g1~~TRINITY_DN17579_c0_g1_i1.p1  ORF type:complete len:291 (+),score=51.22 TRINITY_DN17579_c0_g1_i1:159-1031(+)